MFRITFDGKAEIAGCPYGLDAIDFRRKHGIPDDSDKYVELKIDIVDEGLCRKYSTFLDGGADLIVKDVGNVGYNVANNGHASNYEPCIHESRYHTGFSQYITVSPAALSNYLRDRTITNLDALLQSALDCQMQRHTEAEKEFAEKYAEWKVKESNRLRVEEARTLLKDELEKLKEYHNAKVVIRIADGMAEIEENEMDIKVVILHDDGDDD